MASTTFEEAKRCPRCGLPGEEVSRSPAKGARPGTTVALIYCRTPECRWENTAWPIQINPDGTVPIIDHSQTAKEYPQLLPDAEQSKLIESVTRQMVAETQPGGAEVRNPRSPR